MRPSRGPPGLTTGIKPRYQVFRYQTGFNTGGFIPPGLFGPSLARSRSPSRLSRSRGACGSRWSSAESSLSSARRRPRQRNKPPTWSPTRRARGPPAGPAISSWRPLRQCAPAAIGATSALPRRSEGVRARPQGETCERMRAYSHLYSNQHGIGIHGHGFCSSAAPSSAPFTSRDLPASLRASARQVPGAEATRPQLQLR